MGDRSAGLLLLLPPEHTLRSERRRRRPTDSVPSRLQGHNGIGTALGIKKNMFGKIFSTDGSRLPA
eukprot:scaffold127321_cov66-Phaeocystis_antarctica.AAC.3